MYTVKIEKVLIAEYIKKQKSHIFYEIDLWGLSFCFILKGLGRDQLKLNIHICMGCLTFS
jgi:hypothetical protein